MKTIVQRRLALLGVPADRIDDLEQRVIWRTSIGFARRAPQQWARNVRVPTFLYQVHDDVLTAAQQRLANPSPGCHRSPGNPAAGSPGEPVRAELRRLQGRRQRPSAHACNQGSPSSVKTVISDL
jgi:hypothetical protein